MNQKHNFEAIVFDMDGVLFDTEPMHMEAWVRALDSCGIKHDYGREFFDEWVGQADEKLGLYLEEKHSDSDEPLKGDYYLEKGKYFRDILKEELVTFPGVDEGLGRLLKLLPLAVATSSHRVDLELMFSITGVGKFFQASCSYDDVDKHKPNPEPYLHAAELLNLAPEKCVALEDSPRGVKSAKAAGMLTLGIMSTFDTATLAEADYIFKTTVEAIEWIEQQLRTAQAG